MELVYHIWAVQLLDSIHSKCSTPGYGAPYIYWDNTKACWGSGFHYMGVGFCQWYTSNSVYCIMFIHLHLFQITPDKHRRTLLISRNTNKPLYSAGWRIFVDLILWLPCIMPVVNGCCITAMLDVWPLFCFSCCLISFLSLSCLSLRVSVLPWWWHSLISMLLRRWAG